MREGKEKNGSAQPGAIHNPCSQAFNTVSKVLEVQTVEFTFQSTDNPQLFPDSLVASTTDTMSEPLPYRGGLGPGSSHPHFCSAREGYCPPPPAEACGGKNCPVLLPGKCAVLGYPRSQVHCDGLQCPAHAILWQV